MFTDIFVPEVVGTFVLIMMGCGVVANAILPKTKGHVLGSSWLLINWGWGLAVTFAVYVAWKSGAHLNPAVTLGLLTAGSELGVSLSFAEVMTYIAGQLLGAMLGALVVWVVYKQHLDLEETTGSKLGVFATIPQIRNIPMNIVAEAVATFMLVFGIIALKTVPAGPLAPLIVGLLIFAIGNSLGGPTGYAINPARDLGPRLMHSILPIRGKGSSDWGYGLIVPIIGPSRTTRRSRTTSSPRPRPARAPTPSSAPTTPSAASSRTAWWHPSNSVTPRSSRTSPSRASPTRARPTASPTPSRTSP